MKNITTLGWIAIIGGVIVLGIIISLQWPSLRKRREVNRSGNGNPNRANRIEAGIAKLRASGVSEEKISRFRTAALQDNSRLVDWCHQFTGLPIWMCDEIYRGVAPTTFVRPTTFVTPTPTPGGPGGTTPAPTPVGSRG